MAKVTPSEPAPQSPAGTVVPPQASAAPSAMPRVANTGALDEAPDPRVAQRPPFWLVFHPDTWTVLEGQLVPTTFEYVLAAGIHGVTERKVRQPDGTDRVELVLDEALTNLKGSGRKFIPWDVDGPGTSYIREAASGVWVTRFMRTYPGSSHMECDHKAFAGWLRELVAQGKIPAPRRFVVESMISTLQRQLAELKPHEQYLARSYNQRLEVAQQALEAVA